VAKLNPYQNSTRKIKLNQMELLIFIIILNVRIVRRKNLRSGKKITKKDIGTVLKLEIVIVTKSLVEFTKENGKKKIKNVELNIE